MSKKNFFGDSFEKLPIELQREIYLQNTEYYQQEIANKLIEYYRLYAIYNANVENLKNLRHPQGRMIYLIKVYENIEGKFSRSSVKEAKKDLEEIYKPAVLETKQNIEKYKKQLEKNIEEYNDFKKKYFYFYNKVKKLY